MAPTEGGLETGGTACLHYKSGRGRFLQFLLVNIEMPHNCCVPFCNATSKKNKSLRFHRFPKKKGLKDRWIAKIRRDEGDYFAVTENTRVCSKHFCEEDYTVSKDGKGKKIVLKKGAVPTIFKWSSEKRSRSTFASKGKVKVKLWRRHGRNGDERAAHIAKENKWLSTDCRMIWKKKMHS